ncbi:MAG: signal recognition particle-docking protein FtsY [Oscillospiraceae bacterium]|nr:signal recognition particle-docking protein FtsY [Oscillospiraceae bacterium]
MGFFEKIAEGIRKTRDSVMGRLASLFNSFTKIDEEFFESLEETLIMCDIGAETSIEICDALRKKVKEKGLTDPSEITTELSSIIEEMLGEDKKIELDTKPVIILVIGVNGAGKTTTIGKLASKYIADGKKVIVAAADTFRAAAIEQLEVWCDRAGAEIVKHSEGSDPASVVFDAIQAAKARGADVLICDTAGRLHNKKNLMEELKKINRICQGQAEGCRVETLLVLDATTGQNAVNQAKMFSEVADVSGIVLTKLDGTAKGGIIISIHKELGIPVKLVGVGEKIDDLMEFSAHDFAQALFVSNTNFEGNYERLDEDPEKDEDIGETALEADTAREQGEEELVRDTVETEEIPLDDGGEPVKEEELEEEPVTDTEPDEEGTDEEQPAEETAVQKKSLKDGRFGFLFKEITFGKKKEKTEETSQEDMQ